MLVHQAYRFELAPNNVTRSRFASHCGASRFVYNWGLALVKERHAAREQIRSACYKELLSDEATEALVLQVEVPWTMYDLRREWNSQKHLVAPWWAENSKFAYESGLKALGEALKNFSKSKNGTRAGPAMGFPRPKRRTGRQSCRFWDAAGLGIADERHVRLPRIGVIRSKEKTTELLALLDAGSARILNATLSEEAGRWFIAFCCEVERADIPASGGMVGVDLGIRHLAVLSTGEFVDNPKALNRYQAKMARLGRELARRKVGSRRRALTKHQLARTHRQVRCLRRDALHQLTTDLAANYSTVVIEDLNVKGMTAAPKPRPDPDRPGVYLRNGRSAKAGLNRALADVAPGEFRRQLAYKLAWRQGTLIVADRWYPSSKRCSSCATVKATLSLRTRTYCCETCGSVIDRDLNAARNLEQLGGNVADGRPETKNARRGEERLDTQPSPVKREDGSRQPHKTVLMGSFSK